VGVTLPQYRLDPGERRTIDISISRSGSAPAGPVWFRWLGQWHQVQPADPGVNPAVYPITFAAGPPATGTHPAGTVEISTPVQLDALLTDGADLVVREIGWIIPR